MKFEEDRKIHFHEILFGGLILVTLVMMGLVCYSSIYARIRDISEYEEKEIVISEYYTDYYYLNHGRYDELYIESEDGEEYCIDSASFDELDYDAFEKDVKEGTVVKVYIYPDTNLIDGLEYNDYVYLDVNQFVYTKVDGFVYVLLIGGAIFIGLLLYLIIAYRKDLF